MQNKQERKKRQTQQTEKENIKHKKTNGFKLEL